MKILMIAWLVLIMGAGPLAAQEYTEPLDPYDPIDLTVEIPYALGYAPVHEADIELAPVVIEEEPIKGPDLAIVPLLAGEQASFDGFLVDEERYVSLIKAEIERDGLAGKYEVQRRLTDGLEDIYLDRLKEAIRPIRWYQTPEFNRLLGFGLGFAVAGLAVYGVTQLKR